MRSKLTPFGSRFTHFVLAALLVLATGAASASETTLRWTHANASEIAGFTVHLGYSPAEYAPELTLTFADLSADSNGVYEVTIDIEPDRAMFVAVRAYNDTETSSYSNEQMRFDATPLGLPGRPRLASH